MVKFEGGSKKLASELQLAKEKKKNISFITYPMLKLFFKTSYK